MESGAGLILVIVLSGPVYYVLYRIVFYRGLKWKMIHSLWIPIAGLITGGITLMVNQREIDSSGWGWIEGFTNYMNFMAIVISVFLYGLIYTAFSLRDERKKKQ